MVDFIRSLHIYSTGTLIVRRGGVGVTHKPVRGGKGVGFEVVVGQQGGAATRIAPYLPGFTSVRG